MKRRIGFVSNSSSASFIVKLGNVSDKQKKKIYDYKKCGRLAKCKDEKTRCDGCESHMFDYNDYGWSIDETSDEIRGYTSMNNFDMKFYLREVVGVEEFNFNDHIGRRPW